MGRSNAPIGYTCPDIDKVIDTIQRIIKEMDSQKNNDADILITNIRDWSSDLYDIVIGRNCIMENLRGSNDILRSWGEDMFQKNIEAETYISELEIEIQSLKEQLE